MGVRPEAIIISSKSNLSCAEILKKAEADLYLKDLVGWKYKQLGKSSTGKVDDFHKKLKSPKEIYNSARIWMKSHLDRKSTEE